MGSEPVRSGTGMNGPRYVAGVDAGASHTTAAVTDASFRVLGRAEGPAGAVRAGAEDAAADVILEVVRDATAAAGLPGPSLTAMAVGAAGAGDPTVRATLVSALQRRGAPASTTVCTDADAAFASAFPEGPGILLLSGTGSIALARDPAGDQRRVGGRGWRLGDEGSGYALGRAGVAAAVQALEGRGPPTLLTQSVLAALGFTDPADLFRWARLAEPRAVAALGKVVQEAVDAGDAVALGLLDTAAEDLVAHVIALRPHFGDTRTVPLVLAGGALTRDRPLRRRVAALLGARAPWVAVQDTEVDAAVGAARIALTRVTGGSARDAGGSVKASA